jgi:hypothetical protein
MRRSIHPLRVCFTAAAALALCAAGCERGRSDDRLAGHSALHAEAARFAIDDATLVTQLRDKLSASAAAEGKAVSVRASDGVVTLTGRVSSRAARESAAGLVQEVPGVSEVDNRIVVAQLANRDSRIR